MSDAQVRALAALGGRVAALYEDTPQDIEWALANDTLYLLQARPITSLFPVPEGMTADPLRAMLSFGAVQGMLEPITPLGRSLTEHLPPTFRLFVSGVASGMASFHLVRTLTRGLPGITDDRVLKLTRGLPNDRSPAYRPAHRDERLHRGNSVAWCFLTPVKSPQTAQLLSR